jgi:hypothetical protein
MRTLKILARAGYCPHPHRLPLRNHRSHHFEPHFGEPLSLIELDYPSASFGTQTLAPGQDFHYRFKIIGSGATTILWTDAAHHDHKSSGPTLRDGDDGKLTVTFNPGANPTWNLELLHPAPGS